MNKFFRQQLNSLIERENFLKKNYALTNTFCCVFLFLTLFSVLGMSKISNALESETIYRAQSAGMDRSTTDQDAYDQDFNSFSSDFIPRIRPPKPVNFPQNMQYPPGFLTETKPQEINSSKAENQPQEEASLENGKRIEQELDSDDSEPNTEPLEDSPKMTSQEKGVVFSIIIALVLLAGFFFFDFRYRQWLEHILEQNRHLLSPGAVSDDFAAILHSTATSFAETGSFSDQIPTFDNNSLYSENSDSYFSDFQTKRPLSDAIFSDSLFNSNLNSSDLQSIRNESYESNAALLDISDLSGYQVRQTESH